MYGDSLLVNRLGGMQYQILSDEDALIIVPLGHRRDGEAMRRIIRGPEAFDPEAGMQCILRADVERLLIRRGDDRTEIHMNTVQGDEFTWHMSERLPPEAVLSMFHDVDMRCEELEAPSDAPDGADGIPAGEAGTRRKGRRKARSREFGWMADVLIAGLGVLLPVCWRIHYSGLLFWCCLLFWPCMLVRIARRGRFVWTDLPGILPGIGLTLDHARVNLEAPIQLAAPVVGISVALALMFALLHRGTGRIRRAALVLVLCLLTYSHGAAMAVNGLVVVEASATRCAISRIGQEWVEVSPEPGETYRYNVSPQVARQLSGALPCTVVRQKGWLGIEYHTVMPIRTPDEV